MHPEQVDYIGARPGVLLHGNKWLHTSDDDGRKYVKGEHIPPLGDGSCDRNRAREREKIDGATETVA
jgi:hypothetical protein